MRLRSLSCPPSLGGGNNVRPPAGAPQLRAPLASSSSSNTSAEEEESYDSGSEFTRESTDDELNVDHLISPNINATVASVLERRFEQAVPLMNPNAGQLWFLI